MNHELQFLLYNTPGQDVSINAVVKDETIWVTQKAMAELFDCSTDNISLHLKNIYKDGELNESATTEEFSVVQQEGSREVRRTPKFYNLDAIISVAYRYIENLIERGNTITMEEFAISINEFPAFRRYDILKGKGIISKTQANKKAKEEYDEFNKTQKINSDFDKEVKKLLEKGGENQ